MDEVFRICSPGWNGFLFSDFSRSLFYCGFLNVGLLLREHCDHIQEHTHGWHLLTSSVYREAVFFVESPDTILFSFIKC